MVNGGCGTSSGANGGGNYDGHRGGTQGEE